MKRFSVITALLGLGMLVCTSSGGGEPSCYPMCNDCAALSKKLKAMQDACPDLFHLSSLTETNEGRSVWLVEMGKGKANERIKRPAILVVAGVEGDRLAGSEAALAFLDRLCNDKSIDRSVFDRNTVYVIPRLNPDAAERYFAKPLSEQIGNLTPFDADRDGLTDEDGPDDLNEDGVISWIRVEDAEGKSILHPDDERILVEADAAKGEEGKWLLFREGKDNDLDEEIDEDGPGEVNFNKNFPFKYTFFEPDAGVYQCCEKETRALAEFIIECPHIGLVVTFSSNGSLLKTPDSGDAAERREPQTKLRKEDSKYYDYLGEQYREQIGLTKEVDCPSVGGSFADWIYFHRGRMSVSTSVWSPDIALALKKEEKKEEDAENVAEEKESDDGDSAEKDKNADSSSKEEKGDKEDEKKKEDERGKTEREYLKWVEENAPGYFMDWQSIEHPDYPGQKAEIGGFAPFAKVMPPAELFDVSIDKNADYLVWLIDKLPRIEIYDVEIEDRSNGVFDVCVKVKNTGYLPTVLAHGERTNEVFPTRVEIDVPKEKILAGDAMSRIGSLEGSGGMEEVRWVLYGKRGDKVKVQAVSALGGSVERTFELKGE